MGISLKRIDDSIRIVVQDDGIGFDRPERSLNFGHQGGFGLFSIREGLKYIDGETEISSKAGIGTRVVLRAPLKQKKAKKASKRLTVESGN